MSVSHSFAFATESVVECRMCHFNFYHKQIPAYDKELKRNGLDSFHPLTFPDKKQKNSLTARIRRIRNSALGHGSHLNEFYYYKYAQPRSRFMVHSELILRPGISRLGMVASSWHAAKHLWWSVNVPLQHTGRTQVQWKPQEVWKHRKLGGNKIKLWLQDAFWQRSIHKL